MTDTDVARALAEAIDSVLERMFFVTQITEAPPPGAVSAPVLTARVCFDGAASGIMTLRIEHGAAEALAADFLALDPAELSRAQVADVVRELANMLCGSALSRLAGEARIRLAPPELTDCTERPNCPVAAERSVEVGAGRITVRLGCEAACPA